MAVPVVGRTGPQHCTGGQLQPVLMRPSPQLSFKTRGGGAAGGGGPAGGRGGGFLPGVGGGVLPGVGGAGLAGGHGGVQPGVRGVVVRVRVKVTELVEPVLVL